MSMYLAIRIFNFFDFDSVSLVGIFKYSIIGLLQSGAFIVITSPVSVLGRLMISTKIPLVALESLGSIRESSSALEFSFRGICVN